MQMGRKEPVAVPAGGKPPSICDRLQRAFHTWPAFWPLRRLTVHHQDGGAAPGAAKPTATGAGAGGAPGAAAMHGGPPPPLVPLPPPTPVPSLAGTAPAPTVPSTLPPAPKPAANKGDKPPRDGQVPVSTPTVTATTSNVAGKAAAGTAGEMPVAVPPPAVTGRPPADAKAGDNAQQTKGKTRVGSRVRKALSSK